MTELTASRLDYNLTTTKNDYTLTASRMDYMLTTIFTATATSNQDAQIEQSGLMLNEDGTYMLNEATGKMILEAT